MKTIVFLAPYPSADKVREGMMQRVAAIDSLFSENEYRKIYIVPRYRSGRNEVQYIKTNVECHYLSLWSALNKIISLINSADLVYCHSLYGISLVGFFFWRRIKTQNVIWDVHGIIPEELKYANRKRYVVKVYSLLEKIVANNVPKIVVVTETMKKHLLRKYPRCNARFYTYPILPITVREEEYNSGDEVVILYSGNVQAYQNIPLMIESIASVQDVFQQNSRKVRFEILTGAPDRMKALFKQGGMKDTPNIKIHSVDPSRLSSYYTAAHYGYVLRDDVDLNNVACPTKLTEYLAYGLTPIVLSPNIGDFREMGYQYIEVDKIDQEQLYPHKNDKNIEIYRTLVEKGSVKDYMGFIRETPTK